MNLIDVYIDEIVNEQTENSITTVTMIVTEYGHQHIVTKRFSKEEWNEIKKEGKYVV